MAPNRSSAHSSLNPAEVPTANGSAAAAASEERDIWSSILQQVQKTATNKLPSNKSILVLGDNDSGKTSLIAKMQGMDTTCKGSGLEYHYLMVRDEYLDERTQCGVWILDGNYQWKRDLLKFALNAENFADTTILLLVSMTKPWDIMNSLQHWVEVLEAHIKSLNLDPKVLENFREQNRRRFQDYISPGDEIEGLTSSIHRNRSHSYSGDSPTEPERDPLPENVLCNNLGLDIVVAVAKTDYMSTLEKEYDYKEEHFDFIQQAIRKFCLNYGAALVYVSVKISKNCEVLFKYLVHRIYGLQFKTPALVVEKDAVFIPSGWDNEKKIAILYENIQSFSPDDDFNDIITVPVNANPAQKEIEIVADEDQIFLMKLKGQLAQNEPSNTNTPSRPLASTPQSSSKDRRSTTSANSPATPLMDGGKAGTQGGEGVLQNFFNQLLNRKSVSGSGAAGGGGGAGGGGPGGGGPSGTPGASPRTPATGGSATAAAAAAATTSAQQLGTEYVQAELDRILEGNKSSSSGAGGQQE